ncbi:hypothetical protein [Planctobacterium marinum]|uniref:hypothetical protein n=1 Tax=Planctobacterium marinum TaxID=1631968 RepID=UPI001E46A792|nr:hypothetical protein [Planctobacterium marinum]MCC2606936.1 hypothetical protein [Planctobacterium marinum]
MALLFAQQFQIELGIPEHQLYVFLAEQQVHPREHHRRRLPDHHHSQTTQYPELYTHEVFGEQFPFVEEPH